MRTRIQIFLALMLLLPLIAFATCRQNSPRQLRGQTNATMTFYASAIDQDGHPLEGVQFDFRVEAYPANWTLETRDQDHDTSKITATTNKAGRVAVTITGCELILTNAEISNYRELYEIDTMGGTPNNRFYRLIASGNLWYKSQPENPAIYVFVKEGTDTVAKLPCRGGSESGGTGRWRINKPAWPNRPSLKDVVYKPPTTQPSTYPATQP